jgi:hypothetical protein
MMSSQKSPKVPQWIFFLTDLVLLLAAWFIAYRSPSPLPSGTIYAIVTLVTVGAIVGLVPLVLHYERVKNETLDDRQRGLEALASTLTTAADQISIAAQGLHAITELAQKNLRQAEQLPQTLQEKWGEFQTQLGTSRDEERDEMKKELAALRAIDSERLAAIADKVQKTAGELTKLDASTQKALAALAKAPEAITTATAAALSEIDAKFATRATSTLATLDAAETKRAKKPKPESTPAAAPSPEAEEPSSSISDTPTSKSGTPDVGTHIQPIVPPTSAPFSGNIISISPAPSEQPNVADLTPAAPITAEPMTPATPALAAAEPATAEEAKVPKKRAPRKPKQADVTDAVPLDLEIADAGMAEANGESLQLSPDEGPSAAPEPAISSDGATRLLVTAYIGIGNRLFIRGDGPGLTWDKGVPLQFVSIGKWRWESPDVGSPVKFKLYKNDETECAALGLQSLESGRQQEVTATF